MSLPTTSASVAAVPDAPAPRARLTVGRAFVHPAFDLVVIGGLLTLPIAGFATMYTRPTAAFLDAWLPVMLLVCNQAHFAASTVRLYTKGHTFEDLPFLTMGLPLATFLVVAGFVAFADTAGRHFQALYLTWSPYHYAAQTYGLAAMYAVRSGCRIDDRERALLWTACLLPFLRAFLGGAPFGHGLGWLVPYGTLVATPARYSVMASALTVLDWTSLAAPLLLFAWLAVRIREGRAAMPLLSLVLMVSNATWWVFFPYWNAVVWATVLHGLQYLGIMAVFHAEDRVRRPDNRHGRAFHAAWLLVICIALGYALFQCWPRAFMWAGFGKVESIYMVIAAINIHHFIVDAFIWKIRKDPNYRTVVA